MFSCSAADTEKVGLEFIRVRALSEKHGRGREGGKGVKGICKELIKMMDRGSWDL